MDRLRHASRIDLDRVAVALEEVGDRRREELQVARRDVGELGRRAGEQEDDLDLGAGAANHRPQAVDAHEVEPLRHDEVFAQQPVALEARAGAAAASPRRRRCRPWRAAPAARGRVAPFRPGGDERAGGEEGVEERRRPALLAEVQVEAVEVELGERALADAPDAQAQRGLRPDAADGRDAGGRQRAAILDVARARISIGQSVTSWAVT
jgi:hypothetical protein